MAALLRRKSEAGEQRPQQRSKVALSRRFTVRYVAALVVVAVVAIGGQISTARAAQRVEETSRTFRFASEQLIRLYRIGDLSRELADQIGTDDAKTTAGSLQQELSLLKQVEQGLLRGDAALKLPTIELTPEVEKVFYENEGLDQSIANVVDRGTELVSTAGTAPAGQRPDVSNLTGAIEGNRVEAAAGIERLLVIYDTDLEKAISQQQDTTLAVVTVVALAALVLGFGLFRPMARNISVETGQLEQAEQEHRLNNERQTFRNTLKETLESADTEEEVLATLGRAVRAVVPDLKAEILLVNATESRLVRGADISDHGSPMCPVESPMGCAAFRRSQTEVFESSRMLNACPKLAAHAEGACSAVCVPLKFRGRALGVLHTTAADAHPPSHTQIERLTTIAGETGIQLGTVRATQSDRLQATTDGLTGLLNRRSLETAVTGLLAEHRSFSIAIADLDHFKDLNDTYGHEAGDTALKLFAKVLKANLRPDDIASRYGGEEFVLVLPGTNIREAQAALERLQQSMAQEIERTKTVPFTASWGLTDQSSGVGFDEMVAVADAALYSAKRAGRNCIYVDGEAASAYQELAPDQIWTGSGSVAPDLDADPVRPVPKRT